MKSTHRFTFAALLLSALLTTGCSQPDDYNQLPSSIAHFVTEYFPDSYISSVSHSADGNYSVQVRNGTSLYFDNNLQWIEVNGNGSTLPTVLLYDQLPNQLYDFLQTMDYTQEVYLISRSSYDYEVKLLDTYVSYDRASHKVTYPYNVSQSE